MNSIINLPQLLVKVEGKVLSSNLEHFHSAAMQFIAGIKTDLATDEDFTEAETMVKTCGTAENLIELAKKQALKQTASIDDLFKTLDKVREEIRSKRLSLEKTIKAKKESIKCTVITNTILAFEAHIKSLRERVGVNYICETRLDLGEATKGVKTLESLEAKASAVLKDAMIAASIVADTAETNIKAIATLRHLFPDIASVCTKTQDDFSALLASRITTFKAAEEARIKSIPEDDVPVRVISPPQVANATPPIMNEIQMEDIPRLDLVSRFMATTKLSGMESKTVEGWIRAYVEWAKSPF